MVYYYSGTGNSQFTALQTAELIGDKEVVSINQYLKEDRRPYFESERPLVFVAPTYCWRMPRVVERWISVAFLKGCRDAYFILTCAGVCGNAEAYAEELCFRKGLCFRGLAPVVMPENYLALFPTPSKEECQALMEKAKPRIAQLAERIRSGQPFDTTPVNLVNRLESGPVNPLFYHLFVKDEGFHVTGSCVSCGKCAGRCALNNIDLVDGKPVWKGNCTHCMACIAGCPAEAIEYGTKSQGRHRHYVMNDELCWGTEEEKYARKVYSYFTN